jgi:hypothetical protein
MADGKNDVVLSFNDSLVRQSDVQLLDGPHWLNDIVIGFCFEYVNYYLFCHDNTTPYYLRHFLRTSLQKDKMSAQVRSVVTAHYNACERARRSIITRCLGVIVSNYCTRL